MTTNPTTAGGPPMTPTPPQERANTAEVAGVLRAVLDSNRDIHGWRCEYPDRYGPCTCHDDVAEEMVHALAAASLLRQDPPQVAGEDPQAEVEAMRFYSVENGDFDSDEPAGEDVERVARVLFASHVSDYAGNTAPEIMDRCEEAAREVLAALSACPVEAQEVERLRREVYEAEEDWAARCHATEAERDAALARAEAAEGEVERLRSENAVQRKAIETGPDDLDLLRAEAALRAVVEAVQGLHRCNPLADLPVDDPNRSYFNADPVCVECGADWPCATDAALSAQPVAQEGEEEWGVRWSAHGDVEEVDSAEDGKAYIDAAAQYEYLARIDGTGTLVRRTVTPWVPVETGGEGK